MSKTTMQFGSYTANFYGSIASPLNAARIAYLYARYIRLPEANKERLRVFRASAMRLLNQSARELSVQVKNAR